MIHAYNEGAFEGRRPEHIGDLAGAVGLDVWALVCHVHGHVALVVYLQTRESTSNNCVHVHTFWKVTGTFNSVSKAMGSLARSRSAAAKASTNTDSPPVTSSSN